MYNKVNIYTCLHVNVFLTAGSRWQSKWMWCRFTNHCWTWNPRKGICNSAKPNSLFTLHAWLRGKVISLYICCCCRYRRHENHQVWRYVCRHRYVQLVNTKNLSKSAKKGGFSVLWIIGYGPRAWQTVCLCWPRLPTTPTAAHVLSAHAHNCQVLLYKQVKVVNKFMQLSDWCRCSMRGVCASESSSCCLDLLVQFLPYPR